MAEEDKGIHPEVMRHIVDLHRKHSELQMQMHDKGSGEEHEVFQQMLTELRTLNENLSKLIPAIEADTKADRKEGGESARPRRERKSAAGASGANAAEA